MNGYADDLAQLIESLDLHDITMVGHYTGVRGVGHVTLLARKEAFTLACASRRHSMGGFNR